MQTREYTVYKYSELKPEIQAEVLENYYNINTDYDWWDMDFETIISDLTTMGYEDIDISFSGFGSQGDGASFTAKNIDLIKWLEYNKRKSYYKKLIPAIESGQITGEVVRIDNQYSHYNTCRVQLDELSDYYNDQKVEITSKHEKLIVELEAEIEADRKMQSIDIYKQLEKTYEYLTSEEAIIETIEANDYDFTMGGKID